MVSRLLEQARCCRWFLSAALYRCWRLLLSLQWRKADKRTASPPRARRNSACREDAAAFSRY